MYTKNHSGKIFLLLFLIMVLQTSRSFSQGFTCASKPSQEYVNYLLARDAAVNKTTTAADPSKLATLKTISITVWIVKDSLRNPGVSLAAINLAIEEANKDFKPMNLAFKVCGPPKYIENFQYDSLDVPDSDLAKKHKERELYREFHDNNTINMYFVSMIQRAGAPCGYAFDPKSSQIYDMIVIKKSCTSSPKVIPHELGHYFGLLHTFDEKTFGKDFVNEKNCGSLGDRICDTEADPEGATDLGCNLFPPKKDANGDFYTPPTGNIMSYYEDRCKCGFTKGQFVEMTKTYLNFRKYLY